MNAVQRLDRYQREHTWLGAPLAVVYKFFEDRGPYLSALVTYYAFVSLFPLLLVFYSSLGFFLDHHPSLRRQLEQSVTANFPIIGERLQSNISSFHGSGAALAVGVIGTLYGGMGVMQAAQTAFNRIYAVPRNEQPNPFRSRIRSIGLLLLFGLGVVLSTAVASVAGPARAISQLGTPLRLAGLAVTVLINAAVLTAAFQLLTARELRIRQVATGGVLAACVWAALQTAATGYASHEIQHTSAVYGTFGVVLAAVAWIYLQALAIMLSAEINMVIHQRLWPRALLTPFTDDVELTEADRRAYALHAGTQRFKGFETVTADFGDDACTTVDALHPAHPQADHHRRAGRDDPAR